MKSIPVGTSEEMVITTTPAMGVRHLPISVLSTTAMMEQLELVCLQLMVPHLGPQESSVGYKVNIRHLAPTTIGQTITVKATILECDDKKAVFEVEAHNSSGQKIGDGQHERRVVDMSRFAKPS